MLLLGETRPEFGGSAWASVVHGHLGGRPPAVDLAAERRAGRAARRARPRGLVSSAHDLADGGLAQTLAESALRYGVGARLHLDGDPFTALFSESAARAVVTTSDPDAVRAAAAAGRRAGHRAGDDGRRRARRRRPARAAARRAAGRLDGHAAGAVRHARRPRSAPFRRAPSRPADAGAPIPAEELRAAARAGAAVAGGGGRAAAAGGRRRRGEDHAPAGWPSRCPAGRWSCGCRRTSPSSASRARGTPAARRRTSSRPTRRPGCGWRPGQLTWDDAVAEGKVTASGNRADLQRRTSRSRPPDRQLSGARSAPTARPGLGGRARVSR